MSYVMTNWSSAFWMTHDLPDKCGTYNYRILENKSMLILSSSIEWNVSRGASLGTRGGSFANICPKWSLSSQYSSHYLNTSFWRMRSLQRQPLPRSSDVYYLPTSPLATNCPVWTLASILTSSLTLYKTLNFSELQFLCLQNENNHSNHFTRWWEGECKIYLMLLENCLIL